MKQLNRALLVASVILAAGAGPSLAGTFFLQAHGGLSFYNPDDMNDFLDGLNAALGGPFPDHVTWGPEVGLSGSCAASPELNVGLGYARLSGSSGFAWEGDLVDLDLGADIYAAFLEFVPLSGRKIRLGAGMSLGMIRSGAVVRMLDRAQGELKSDFEGAGFLFAGYGIADVPVTSRWSLFGQVGFRHAVINEVQVEGKTVYNPDSLDDKLRINYSGLVLRAGVKFQL